MSTDDEAKAIETLVQAMGDGATTPDREHGELLTEAEMDEVNAILATADPLELAIRVHRFYESLERGERTPRRVMYLHLGYIAGVLNRLATERAIRDTLTRN